MSQFVECFWTLENDGISEPIKPESILPDGCVELILNFGAHFQEHKDNGQQERQPPRPPGRADDSPSSDISHRISATARHTVSSRWDRSFLSHSHARTDQPRSRSLGALTSEFERDLVARVEAAPSLSLKIAAVEKLLTERVRGCKRESWLPELAATVVHRGGQVSMDALASAAGVSSRQLERRFLRDVGIGPKLLCRIVRFQQVFRAVQRDDLSWAAIAADCGYYDQAHLIRDFQQFARQTPASLFEHSISLTESFMRKNRTSDFSNTLA